MKYRIIDSMYYFLSVIILAIAIVICILSIKNYNHIENKIVNFDDNINSIYLRIVDVYDKSGQKSLSQFFSEDSSLKRMKEFNKTINLEYNCIEFDNQSLLLQDNMNFKDEFRADYGTEIYKYNDNIGISFKSVQIGSYSNEFFELNNKILDGNGFKVDDFKYNNDIIPALMGYEYKDYVKIGDVINFNYLTKNITIRVIGFLEKNSIITLENNIYYLDRYIIIPFLDISSLPVDDSDASFQKLIYSLKNWCYIRIKNGDNINLYRNKIDEISQSLDLNYIVNDYYANNYVKNISNTMNSTKGIILIFSITLLAIMSIIFIYMQIWVYKRNKIYYCMHLICGCSLPKVKLRVFVKVVLQFFIAYIIAYISSKLLLGRDRIYPMDLQLINQASNIVLYIITAVIFIICIILSVYIDKSNIYHSLKQID